MSELLETFDDRGRPTGLVERSVVHASGLWHCSSHVWLLDGEGRVYLQRRAADKDVCPGCWDLTVGEHLRPGERHGQAAYRGLVEELGIGAVRLEPVGGVRRMWLDLPEVRVRDYELQQSFVGRYGGPIWAAAAEVAEVNACPLDQLADMLADDPERFTPWMRQDLAELPLLPGPG